MKSLSLEDRLAFSFKRDNFKKDRGCFYVLPVLFYLIGPCIDAIFVHEGSEAKK